MKIQRYYNIFCWNYIHGGIRVTLVCLIKGKFVTVNVKTAVGDADFITLEIFIFIYISI